LFSWRIRAAWRLAAGVAVHPGRQITKKALRGATTALLTFGCAFLLFAPFSLEAESAAVILSSGSTNVAGYRIEVEKSGSARYTQLANRVNPATPEPRQRLIPEPLVQRFYAGLNAAQPLNSLPQQRCLKSASFGSTLLVQFGDQKTPDLACGDGGNAKLRTLIRDVNEIVKLMTSE
jgi:hypothetical protein